MARDQKKGLQTRTIIGFLDESGISEKPTVRRTWSPIGQTPVIVSTASWKTYSAIGLITCTSAGANPKFFLRIFEKSVTKEKVIQYLKELRRHIKGKLILIWDGLTAHRAKDTTEFVKTQHSWLQVERFPSYAPELNPVEYVWSNSKRKELANFCPEGLNGLKQQSHKCARRLQRNPDLLKKFLRASTLYKNG